MRKQDHLPKLLADFADSVLAQEAALGKGDVAEGNAFVKKYVGAANRLLSHGAVGVEAFASLLRHKKAEVRTTAAYYLLPYRTNECLAVLEKSARGTGVTALGALMTLARWKGGEKKVWEEIALVAKKYKRPKLGDN